MFSALSSFGSLNFDGLNQNIEKKVEEVFNRELSVESVSSELSEDWSSISKSFAVSNPKRELYEKGLYDPGSGEVCAKYIPLSDSDINGYQYYLCKSVKDPGIENALFGPVPERSYDGNGQELYLELCKEMNIAPVRLFYRDLLAEVINLKYYGPKSIRIMCLALKRNTYVRRLDLTSNYLSEDACYHIGQLVSVNTTLKELILSGCRITYGGLLRIMVNFHRTKMVLLDLSNNQIRDTDIHYVTDQLLKGAVIERLNLSHNCLALKGCLAFANVLEFNITLTHLDLSWNQMYSPRGSTILLHKICNSQVLVELNMAWNSLTHTNYLENIVAMKTLKKLNLSHNRLDSESAQSIAAGLQVAKNLNSLDLSFNNFTPNDALKILTKTKRKALKIETLLLENIEVEEEFVQLLTDIKSLKHRERFNVTYGRVRKKCQSTVPNMKEIVMKRLKYLTSTSVRKKKNKIDIGGYFLHVWSTQSKMNPKDLRREMHLRQLSVDDDLVDELSKAFPGPKLSKHDRYIDLNAVAEYVRMNWPETKAEPLLPPPKVLKNKNQRSSLKKL